VTSTGAKTKKESLDPNCQLELGVWSESKAGLKAGSNQLGKTIIQNPGPEDAFIIWKKEKRFFICSKIASTVRNARRIWSINTASPRIRERLKHYINGAVRFWAKGKIGKTGLMSSMQNWGGEANQRISCISGLSSGRARSGGPSFTDQRPRALRLGEVVGIPLDWAT